VLSTPYWWKLGLNDPTDTGVSMVESCVRAVLSVCQSTSVPLTWSPCGRFASLSISSTIVRGERALAAPWGDDPPHLNPEGLARSEAFCLRLLMWRVEG
jgi:hypothetical protein